MIASPLSYRLLPLVFLLGLFGSWSLPILGQAPKEPEFQGKSLSTWMKQLQDPAPANRKAAAQAIRKFGNNGSPALDALLTAAKDSDPAVRAEAIKTLNHQPASAKSVPVLIAALKDNSPDVRYSAVTALYRSSFHVPETREAIKPLIAAMEDTAPRVRSEAASALSGFGPVAKDAIPALTAALDDKNRSLRASAAFTLSRIGPDAKVATPKLIALLRAPPDAEEVNAIFDQIVRKNAAMALGRITRGSDVAVESLIAALDDKGLEVAVYAAMALGEIGPPAKAAIQPLQGFVKTEKDARIRIHAAAALMRIDPQFAKSSMKILISGLTDERMFVRYNALGALGELGPLAEEAVPALQKLLQDPDERIQDDAARTLKKIAVENKNTGGK